MEEVVDPSRATVLTDAWQGYAGLPRRGFHHRSETQGSGERAAELLPWAHTIFSNLKTWLRGTFHGVSDKHLPVYAREFIYRFNRRRLRDQQQLFGYVVRRVVRNAPTTRRELVHGPSNCASSPLVVAA